MSIGAMHKLPDSWHNHDRSGVMVTTLAAQPICAKIGHTRAGPGGGLGLLQCVGVLGPQCKAAWEDDACLSERCRSFQIVGATRTEVASC